MRKTVFILIFISFAGLAKAQHIDTSAVKKDTTQSLPVERIPEFPGGLKAFVKYIHKNIHYPDGMDSEGRVNVSFVIEKDGSLSEIKVVKHSDEAEDAEAIRLVTNSPKWIPGVQNGHPVRVLFTVPIFFNYAYYRDH